MANKIGIACAIAVLMIAGTMLFSGVSTALPTPIPPPPSLDTPTPTPVPPSPPSGGSSAPSYSAPPSFQPYTEDLHASDGTVVGNLTGVDFSTVRLEAAGVSADGSNRSIYIQANLGSKPWGATLDIHLGPEGNVPAGMDDVVLLSSATLNAVSSTGWPLTSGVTVRFTIPASELPAGSDAKYYLVHYDGTSYRIVNASVTSSDGGATIEAAISSLTGTITAVMSGGPKSAAASPSPEPTLAPAAAAQPTPTPGPSGVPGAVPSGWVSIFGMFTIGETAGAGILLLISRFSK